MWSTTGHHHDYNHDHEKLTDDRRMQFWLKLLAHLQGGQPAFLGLVADNTAHSPGTCGAKLFVRPDGSTEGTIGGGIMEADIIEHGVQALAADEFEPERQVLFHRPKGKGDKSGLICAGHQTNIYYVCRPERDLSAVEEIVRRLERDEPGLLELGATGLRLTDEDTISPEQAPIRLIESGEEDDSWCYQEQLLNWKRAAIIGGGHCGLALSRVLTNLGYTVTLFDTREDIFTFVENEHARYKIAVDDFAQASAHIDHPEITHVIVMTMGQPGDVRGLLGTIEGPYPYIGVMGSEAKLAKIWRDLEAEGVDPALFERVWAPIGLEMTSNIPEEIAISIAAELLRERETLFPHSKPARP
jgi:xanthine dehydrogenase accessory factor